jgi:hypothetical protein
MLVVIVAEEYGGDAVTVTTVVLPTLGGAVLIAAAVAAAAAALLDRPRFMAERLVAVSIRKRLRVAENSLLVSMQLCSLPRSVQRL